MNQNKKINNYKLKNKNQKNKNKKQQILMKKMKKKINNINKIGM